MWNLNREDDYYRIYDSNKDIAGYFDPDYGELFPKEKEQELIEQMHKNKDKIPGGFLMVPMVKFGIFEPDKEMSIIQLEKQLDSVQERLSMWKTFLSNPSARLHFIRVAHTDQDMLSVTFPIKFSQPIPLEKNALLSELEPILGSLQKQGLL